MAYLKPARNRANLKIVTDAQTEKVVIEGGRAIAVRARIKGRMTEVRARREIVLSAGAIGSPQILMLSGVGAGDELQDKGIVVKRELKGVGKNLQDHLQARPVYKTDLSTINIETSSLFKQARIALEYALRQSGPMTMAASLGTGFLKTEPHPALERRQADRRSAQVFGLHRIGLAAQAGERGASGAGFPEHGRSPEDPSELSGHRHRLPHDR